MTVQERISALLEENKGRVTIQVAPADLRELLELTRGVAKNTRFYEPPNHFDEGLWTVTKEITTT